MNQSQIKHLKERLSSVKQQKFNDIGSPFTTREERETEFAAGRYEIEGSDGDYRLVYPRLQEKYEGVTTKQKKINQEYQRLLDEIILGDAEGALEALNKFREQEF